MQEMSENLRSGSMTNFFDKIVLLLWGGGELDPAENKSIL